ncbi:MAG: hypothetical protein KF773_01680 [Deltaproteobacteria bacterium]|nr:hypothetical protein [Deltaproteobacteria bacterium]
MPLSPLAFGSMRLHERDLGDEAWLALFDEARELGVTTLHSSSEYESHPRFVALLRRWRPSGVQHIVKLAEPHFGDVAFDRARLVAKVDAYLAELGAERLDVVQWMWRGDLKDEPGRLAGLDAQAGALAEAFAALRAAGKIGAVAPFPYTPGFADAAIEAGCFDGLAVYLNPLEREMLPQIERCAARGLGVVAIRPLCAGKALATASPATCVRGVLSERGVASAVVTYSSAAHLRELVEGARQASL